jgi:hypothetical protein
MSSSSINLAGGPYGAAPKKFTLVAAGSTNATSVKAGRTRLNSLHITNGAVAARYVKLFDKATAPTMGTDTPVLNLQIPAGVAVSIDTGAFGIGFDAGLALGLTTGQALDNATAVTAGDVVINATYF